MNNTYPLKRLCDVGVSLLDCEHKTPKPNVFGYPYIAIPNIQNGRLDLTNVRRISKEDYLKWTKKIKPQSGDVILTRRARVGDTAVVPAGLECAIGQNLVLLRSDGKQLSQKYLRWVLRSPQYWVQVEKYLNRGAVFDSLNCRDILLFEIPVPPMEIQKKIAAILSSLDDKIEINTRMNKVLEETARALFHRWFVEFEFPNDEGKPYKSSGGRMIASEMGEIPEGWRVMSLDQIADFMNGLACQKYPPQNDEEGLPVLKIRELRSANLSDADRVSSTVPKKYYVTDGDVIFSWSGSLIVDIWCSGLVILNQHLFKVTSDTYPKWFYYSWIEYHLSEFQGIASDKATTMGHIQRKHLTNSKVVVPPSEVLEKMNLIMEPLLEQMIRDKCENLYLCKCRDSLLPKLMNNTIGLD